MQSNAGKLVIAGLAIAAVVVLFIVFSGSDDDDSTTTTPTTAEQTTGSDTTSGSNGGQTENQAAEPEIPVIEIKDGEPVGGVQELTFTQGDDIRFKVDSDVADEVHFHGYDVGMEVEAGGSVTFDVPATDTGVFEVELEQRVVPIAEITVNPS